VTKPDPTIADIARLREASEWIQRLNASTAQAVTDQWLQWCKSDPLNLPAYEKMQTTWDAIYRAKDNAPAFPQIVNRRRPRSALILLAATIALTVGVVGWLVLRHSNVQILETAIGEERSIKLSDGSSLDLAPDSRVSTRFTLAEREVQLERGEAFFAVAHSSLRPFVVKARSLKVTTVGTEFDIRIDPSGTEVTVSQGRVTVAALMDEGGANRPANAGSVRAGVGERVTFSGTGRQLSVASVDPKVAESWRGGKLQFESDSLEDVVGVVNRYGAPQIAVAPAWRQARFTGTVSPEHIRDWLKALEQVYAVEMVDQNANEVLIRSRTDDGA
jgi:transmembrane sensor